jgi:uncharacterized membrane-anchored protein YitT (DUF2179 family)
MQEKTSSPTPSSPDIASLDIASDADVLRHSRLEDIQALAIGTLLVALGVTLFQHAGLLSGGTAGIAFLLHYVGGWSFGVAYFVINLPFYWIAWKHMGNSSVNTVLDGVGNQMLSASRRS